jgi:hypothetical protein
MLEWYLLLLEGLLKLLWLEPADQRNVVWKGTRRIQWDMIGGNL